MPIITLMTDFGLKDEYVGVMKGAILSINPDAKLIDITHNIEPQNIAQAARMLPHTFIYFPEGTIHLIIVDPGVGGDRKALAVEANNHFFVVPDNGILTEVFNQQNPTQIVDLNSTAYFLPMVSATFHGRDIFAPVAAHISKGIPLSELGTPISDRQVCKLQNCKVRIDTDNVLHGEIIDIDQFGNLITNFKRSEISSHFLADNGLNLILELNHHQIEGLSQAYSNAPIDSPIVIIGSRGNIEIAVNQGKAKDFFNAQIGDTVKITSKKLKNDMGNDAG